MAKNKKTLKGRSYMYEQQLKHLPNNMTHAEMYEHIIQKTKPKRIAYIVHDKDLKDDNKTPAEDHGHYMLQYENARSLNRLAKDIGDNPQQLTLWNSRPENGFSYLVHATDNARNKHQYDYSEVTANFDYSEYMAKTHKTIKIAQKGSDIASARRINLILDLIATGEITLLDAKNQLSGSDYAKARDKLKSAHELYLDRSAEELHRQMVENNEMVSVHWFYGESETGKSYLAEQLAQESGLPYYKTTTSTDPFQFYQAEPIIILDELRPDMIPYSELLALLNPFSRGKVAVSSRYFNKALSCKTVFITTPYCPVTFYRGYKVNHVDRGEQLFRRLSSVLKFDMDHISDMKYNNQRGWYESVAKKANHYSKKNQKQYSLNSLFEKIV